ncbi:MAG TPA: MCE family protein, partial [Ignavibacteria bacterium]|nr:MCE family protein [Ignavibacteria bacterium]
MKTKYNELFIGLSVTIVLFIVIGGIMWLERSNFLEHGLNLNLVVENAKGIQVSDYIFYKGLDVGTVQSAKLSPKGIVVKLKITKVDTIPIDSKFEIKEMNLLGEKGVEITPGYSKSYLKNDAFVYGTSSGGITALLDSGKILTHHLDKIFTNIDSLSNKKIARKVRATLIKLDESVGLMHRLLKENLGDIHQTIQN